MKDFHKVQLEGQCSAKIKFNSLQQQNKNQMHFFDANQRPLIGDLCANERANIFINVETGGGPRNHTFPLGWWKTRSFCDGSTERSGRYYFNFNGHMRVSYNVECPNNMKARSNRDSESRGSRSSTNEQRVLPAPRPINHTIQRMQTVQKLEIAMDTGKIFHFFALTAEL